MVSRKIGEDQMRAGLKWTVLVQIERSEGVKMDGPKVRKWTMTYETGRSEIQKWKFFFEFSWKNT